MYDSRGWVCLQGAALQGIEPDEETLRLILESIRGGADDSDEDEDEDEDEMQQVNLSCEQTIAQMRSCSGSCIYDLLHGSVSTDG